MGTVEIALQRMFRRLVEGNVGQVIDEIDVYLSAWPNPLFQEKLDSLKQEYQLMTDYWQQGVKDPQRPVLYQRLLQRLYRLCGNLAVHRHLKNSSYLQTLSSQCRSNGKNWSMAAIRQEMENFVSEVAMLELEPEPQRSEKSTQLYSQHHQQMNGLFNYVLTSSLWTDSVGQAMEDLLLAPTVDSMDQQLLVSAVTLSLMNRFDFVKFRMLVHVYQRSQDEPVRQRALVGWIMGIDDDFLNVFPEQRPLVAEVLASERSCQELTELQIQLIYALRVEQDTMTIQDEIIPDLLQNSSLRMTPGGIREVEDSLDDVLHPEAAEQRMEKLEESARRMMDMQKQGADVYFGGFSQMKRFPFFYDISNWLVPFYQKHPDIAQFIAKVDSRFTDFILKQGMFCDSDKYSFVIAYHHIYASMPDNLKEMLKMDNGAGIMGMESVSREEQQKPAYIRRMYLMNLYRFFRLFPNRSALCNPFDTTRNETGMCLFMTSALFAASPLEQYKREVVALLMKTGMKKTATLLLQTFPDALRDLRYYLWTGDYAKALEKEPNDERALLGSARTAFNRGDYDEAIAAYDHLLLLRPDKESYQLNRAICQIQMKEYDEAQQMLFQLNYKNPDNLAVKRALAWSLTCDGKLEQADNYYQQLLAEPKCQPDDYLNRGYCLWLQGRIADAASSFRHYLSKAEHTDDKLLFSAEEELLRQAGITDIDIKMMESLVTTL